ncbi:unnamed protein product [Blepharisma stoltei]|uniref:Cyclin-like domain-containing protein n=1 Tax=Blepharisma stoltei TaxID=1481888 RepID=A0AAU9JN31_9CILI|nr:unnamed protein product [Blepharisma stoltei]
MLTRRKLHGSSSSHSLMRGSIKENITIIKITKGKSRTPRRSSSPIPRIKNISNLPLSESIPQTFLITEAQSFIPKPLAHQIITPENRSMMVDWMVEVTATFCTPQTFFLATKIMDKFFAVFIKPLETSMLHVLGVTSMFIASKFEDNVPLRLKQIIEKIAHNRLTYPDIKITELLMLKFLGFRVNFTTCYDFLLSLATEFRLPQSVFETAKIICYYSQIFYSHLDFKASQVGFSALIIACTSLNQHSVASKLIEKYKDGESLNPIIKKIRADILDLPRLKNLYASPAKFLEFEIALKTPGPLFRFLNPYVEQEQQRLLSNPN